MDIPSSLVHRLDIGPVAVYWGDVEGLRPYLSRNLPANMVEESIRRFASTSRREEWLTVRLLLSYASRENGKEFNLTYQADGRPVLSEKGIGISISHSKGRVCVALSPGHTIGIDIELCSEQAFRARSMFFTPEDLACCPDAASPSFYTMAWSAKECLYKLMQQQEGLSLPDIHLRLSEIPEEEGIIQATVRGKLYDVHCLFLDAYILTCSFLPRIEDTEKG